MDYSSDDIRTETKKHLSYIKREKSNGSLKKNRLKDVKLILYGLTQNNNNNKK